jgi:hypothetical protein
VVPLNLTSWFAEFSDPGLGSIVFPLVAGESVVEYPSGCICGAGHETVNGTAPTKYYQHKHVSLNALPRTVVLPDLSVRTITNDKINDYWEYDSGWMYEASTRQGNPNLTYNCFSYAFGIGAGVWVDDPGQVYSDDYNEVTTIAVGQILRHISSPENEDFHAVKVTGLCNNPESAATIAFTSEKNGGSAIYETDWDCPQGAPAGSSWKKK